MRWNPPARGPTLLSNRGRLVSAGDYLYNPALVQTNGGNSILMTKSRTTLKSRPQNAPLPAQPLDPGARDRLAEEGYLVLPGLLDPARDLGPLRSAYHSLLDTVARRMHAEGVVSSTYADLPFGRRFCALVGEMGGALMNHMDICLPQRGIDANSQVHCGPAAFGLLTNPRLLDAVEQIVGPEIYANPTQHVRIKPPEEFLAGDTTIVGEIARAVWHQDLATVMPEADRSRMLTVEGGGSLFLQAFNPPLRMMIVGAVHITQALAPIATLLGYEVTVVDPRRAFASDERFPGVHVDTDWPDDALHRLAPDRRTAVVTLTHDPKLDDPALEVALASEAFYIGSLGSRRTHAARLERIRARGIDEAALTRVHGPIGFAIGARSPAEIATAIAAEITARLRESPPGETR